MEFFGFPFIHLHTIGQWTFLKNQRVCETYQHALYHLPINEPLTFREKSMNMRNMIMDHLPIYEPMTFRKT